MNKRMHPILFILPLILGSCNSESTLFKKTFSGCSTFFETTIYSVSSDYENELRSLITYYHNLFDPNHSHHELNNVYTINNTNDPVSVDENLYDALKLSDAYISQTEGMFNPYLGEITFAYKDAYNNNCLPDEEIIKTGLNNLKDFKLLFDDDNKTVQRVGNSLIDLGGFAKGYIIDKLQEFMDSHNETYYLLNGGRSSLYMSEKPNGAAFNIQIDYISNAYIEVKNSSISVSGTYREDQYVTINNKRYSHIINPFTGRPDATSDCVVLKGNIKSSLMDALSTVFILLKDENEYKKFAEKFDVEYLVLKDRQFVSKSQNMEVKRY